MTGVEFGSSIYNTPFLAIVLPALFTYLLLAAVGFALVTRDIYQSTIKRKFLRDGAIANQKPRSGSIPMQEREDSHAS